MGCLGYVWTLMSSQGCLDGSPAWPAVEGRLLGRSEGQLNSHVTHRESDLKVSPEVWTLEFLNNPLPSVILTCSQG